MQIKKIFAAIAASAMAISAMAVSAFADPAISGAYVVQSIGDWHWDTYDLTEEDLIDDIDPANVSKIVVKVKEASHTWPVTIQYNSTEIDPSVRCAESIIMPGETLEITDVLFGECFFFSLCMCTDQPVSNNVTWEVYAEGESAAEGDDTAADDTAGDDTAADDTAGDDTAADDTAGDDVATSVAFSNSYEVKSSGAWWDAYEPTIEELIGDDVDPSKLSKIVVKVEEASHTCPLKVYYNSSENDPEADAVVFDVMPGETLEITDVRFDEFYWFALCISTDQLISNNVTWEVYTEGEYAAEGDDTAADDTAGDDTAADDTAGDDTAADGETGAGAGEGTDGDKANSDTGVEGLAVVAGLAIVATGAVVVAKKRG